MLLFDRKESATTHSSIDPKYLNGYSTLLVWVTLVNLRWPIITEHLIYCYNKTVVCHAVLHYYIILV